MAFCRLVFPLLVLSVVEIYAAEVPVFLWGDVKSNYNSNPLTTVQKNEFDNILMEQLQKDTLMVTFIDQTLSVEDFSLKNSDGKTVFPYLHDNLMNSVYVPSVKNPLKEINSVADPNESSHVKLTKNGLSDDIMLKNSKFLFIYLNDAREGELRSELLLRHNNFMMDMVGELHKQYNHIVAVYTGQVPSWTPVIHSRVRREANVTEGSDHRLDGLHIYVGAVKLESQNLNTTVNLTDLNSSTSQFGEGNMTTTLNYPQGSLTLNFRAGHGYWFFDTVTLQLTNESAEELYLRTDDVYALLNYSYRCGQEVVFASINETKSYKLTFEDIQIQPFFGTVNSTDFGESFNCVGFFSVAIWSGLFVVFILLAITFFGIMMMMDIRTMDRFDDPKGKTITINAGE